MNVNQHRFLLMSVGGCLALLFASPGASGQEVQRGQNALNLPRQGYETKGVRIGRMVLNPELEVSETYDSNVFATPDNERDDFITSVSPAVGINWSAGKLSVEGQAQADILEYADNPKEGGTTYSAGAEATYLLNRANTIRAGAGYERQRESRADPESTIGNDESPSKIDLMSANASYDYRRNRVGLGARISARHVDYLRDDESDRDRWDYRASGRTTFTLTPRFDLFAEGYINRRDHEDAIDRGGFDRDVTTYGLLAGTAVDITGKWFGEIGIGILYADPDDSESEAFSGLAARGSLIWNIRERTSLTASVAREDVATVTPGASGRIDTRISLRLDQEIRHNLLLSAAISAADTEYTDIDRDQTTYSAGAQLEYLVNRYISVVGSVGYTDRTATDSEDEYDQIRTSIGMKFRF